ncbi:MAG: hypothetical protein LBU31_03970, partial [Coriobacteriales bacterium]|nr:hypothetical protein [Coriobacteriales bacterium]
MQKRYSITDNNHIDYGLLTYDTNNKAWHIEINPERTWDDTPFSLAIYIKKGIYTLDEAQSLSWIRDRLLPPNRQNINYILKEIGASEYDEMAFIQITKGVSPNDSLFLVE